jgi:hypothetical protein
MIARRLVLLTLLAIAVIATSAQAQNFPGPSSPALARLYFYRIVESNEPTRWTGVFLNDDKIGDLGERSYFFRDIQPGTYKIGVSSDVPYSDQYRTITVTANSTTFIRVFLVPGYGIQFQGGGLNAPPSIYRPSVFGNSVMAPAIARQEMAGLSLAGN